MSDVIEFTGTTVKDLPTSTVTRWADDLTEAIVIGWDAEGELYVAGSSSDVANVVYLLEKARLYMLTLED